MCWGVNEAVVQRMLIFFMTQLATGVVSLKASVIQHKKSKCSNNPYSPCRTSSQWSPLDNESSLVFELLHATFQGKCCTSSRFSVTLNEHHLSWNQTVESSHVKHSTKFETNRFTSVMTQDKVNWIFYRIMSAEFSPLNSTCAKWI